MGEEFGNSNTGNLAFGPDGNLYFDSENVSGVPTLYTVNTTTGVATGIGSGLNTSNPLTLVSNGTTLFGIDTYTSTNPAIYTIDTTTGVATTIGTVSGLGYGYTLDTMAPGPAAFTPAGTTSVESDAVVNFDGTFTSLGSKLTISAGTANLGGNNVTLESLDLTGGTLTGTGTVTVTGALTWSGGTLQVDGTFTSDNVVTVATGSTLEGIGMVSGTVSVQAGGDLAPGDAGDSSGILNTANMTLNSGANFDVDLNGTTAGTQYDQLNATGTVNLAGATLNLFGHFTPVTGDVFTIVQAASITGTFNGLAQNSIIPSNGRSLKVSYTANTVTLTDATAAITPTIVWPTLTIDYGTPLGTTQLDATASYDGQTIAGSYYYATGLGIVLNAGSQSLFVSFTPFVKTYKVITGMTTINVLPAPLTVTVNAATRAYGQANPTFTVTYTGLVPAPNSGELAGVLAFATTAVPSSNVGTYEVQVGGLSALNYAIEYVPGVLSVVPATLTFTAANKVRNLKAANTRLTFTESGLVPGQSAKQVFKGALVLSTTATKKSPIGKYAIVVKQGTLRLINKNYTFKFVSGILQVVGKLPK